MPSDAAPETVAPPRRGRLVLTLAVLVATLALDLWSKNWAWENLRQQKPITIIDPLLEFSFSFNLGAAFGFLNDASWSRVFFIVVTLLALSYMTWLAFTLPTRRSYGFVAIGLISAGAAGNLHDRLIRANDGGYYGVVDFIKVNYPWGGSWPTFNVADALLLIGVVLLFIYLRRVGDELEETEEGEEASSEASAEAKVDAADPSSDAAATPASD